MSVNPLQVHFKAADKYWTFDSKAAACVEVEPPQEFVIKDGYDPQWGLRLKYSGWAGLSRR